jgi:hypothetical protein
VIKNTAGDITNPPILERQPMESNDLPSVFRIRLEETCGILYIRKFCDTCAIYIQTLKPVKIKGRIKMI